MELQIYSDDAMEIVKLGEMTQEETIQYYKKHSKDDIGAMKAILGAYAGELIIAAEEAGVKLDLTFDTIRNIPDALEALYKKQHKAGYEDSRNKDVTCRTFAAYIDLLIINNFDDCSIDARRYPNKAGEPRQDVWANYLALVLDGQKNSDMLPFISKGARLEEDKVVIDIKPLVDGFKKLTGNKLTDQGLTDITLTHDPDEPGAANELGTAGAAGEPGAAGAAGKLGEAGAANGADKSGDNGPKLIIPGQEEPTLITPNGKEPKLIL